MEVNLVQTLLPSPFYVYTHFLNQVLEAWIFNIPTLVYSNKLE